MDIDGIPNPGEEHQRVEVVVDEVEVTSSGNQHECRPKLNSYIPHMHAQNHMERVQQSVCSLRGRQTNAARSDTHSRSAT